MKLTILGNNGPFPSAGGACSGYLIEDGGTKILIDCGNGVLSNLFKFIKFEELDAIILTHLHSDHMSDMMILRYAIDIKNKKEQTSRLISVFAPNSPAEEFKRLDIKDVFLLKPITSNLELKIGELIISFCEMKHPVKSFAVGILSKDKRFVFSGDTSWNENIAEFSKKTDLLMLDSGLLSKDKRNENAAHLTAEECGIVAKTAGVKRLLLTHFWPEYDLNDILLEARLNFESAEIANLLESYEL